jgi:hypothetical protein
MLEVHPETGFGKRAQGVIEGINGGYRDMDEVVSANPPTWRISESNREPLAPSILAD